MAYSDFNLRSAREKLRLILREGIDIYSSTPAVEASPQLRDFLKEWSPAAVAMNTEKARSEMIIAPILMEAVRLWPSSQSLLRPQLDVDKERGLSGVCDYLLALSSERFFLSHPVVAVVEAKREDINNGLGQCAAGLSVPDFQRAGRSEDDVIHGDINKGTIWVLQAGRRLHLYRFPEYYLHHVDKILGILWDPLGFLR